MSFLGSLWSFLFLALYLVTGAIAALAVYRDAQRRDDLFLNLHPLWWAVVTLIGSITGLGIYWLFHYSSLRRVADETGD